MRGEYIDKLKNILLVGNSGTGMTHLTTALGIAACGQWKRVRFCQVTELITQPLGAMFYNRCFEKVDNRHTIDGWNV